VCKGGDCGIMKKYKAKGRGYGMMKKYKAKGGGYGINNKLLRLHLTLFAMSYSSMF
jgi:hypothetical protein